MKPASQSDIERNAARVGSLSDRSVELGMPEELTLRGEQISEAGARLASAAERSASRDAGQLDLFS